MTDWNQVLNEATARNDTNAVEVALFHSAHYEPALMTAVTNREVTLYTLNFLLTRYENTRFEDDQVVDWNYALVLATGAGLVDKILWIMSVTDASELYGMHVAAEQNSRWHIARMIEEAGGSIATIRNSGIVNHAHPTIHRLQRLLSEWWEQNSKKRVQHAQLMDFAIALAPLNVSSYELMWLLSWAIQGPLSGAQRLRLLDGVRVSVTKIHESRSAAQ
jgi:hypothetical protein